MILGMRYSHVQEADLNLLVAFQALMEERNITRAARRMYISQSAMSRAFARLQVMLQDKLLVRTEKGYEPTHRANHVYTHLDRMLPGLEQLLRGNEFNPAEAKEAFRIAAGDYSSIVIFPDLMKMIDRQAPGIEIQILPTDEEVLRKLENNLIDLTFRVKEVPQPFRSDLLFREEFVCVLRTGHPFGRNPLPIEKYLELDHVAISFPGRRQGLVEEILEGLNCPRHVRFQVPYCSAVMPIVENTDMVATMPKRIAMRLSSKLGWSFR